MMKGTTTVSLSMTVRNPARKVVSSDFAFGDDFVGYIKKGTISANCP
jgi:hypothetical protein